MSVRSFLERELGLSHDEYKISGVEALAKLDLYKQLRGHDGCVNTLKWSRDGSLLVSGSDDCFIRLWDVEGNELKAHETSHIGNIFGVEFVPGTGDRYVMTGAGDGAVIVTDLETGGEVTKWENGNRIKRLASCIYNPKVCWTAEESKSAKLYDIREEGVAAEIKLAHKGKTIDVSERNPNLVVVGGECVRIPIYDIRCLSKPIMTASPLDRSNSDPFYVTHVKFAAKSDTLLVNYGRAPTCLFNIGKSGEESEFVMRLDKLLATNESEQNQGEKEAVSHGVKELIDKINICITEHQYVEALDMVNEELNKKDVSVRDRAALLIRKSAVYMARKHEQDSYEAAKLAISACLLLPFEENSMLKLISIFHAMEQIDLTLEMAAFFRKRFPTKLELLQGVEEDLRDLPPSKRKRNIRMTAKYLRDYDRRFNLHSNARTDIKEASFFGPEEEFVMTGSDSGHIFVYNREDESIVTLLKDDSKITNIIQPHPILPLVASSGIDHDIRLFASYAPPPVPTPLILPSPSSSSSTPPPPISRRISFREAEMSIARASTRELVREMLIVSRLREGMEGNQCQVQ